MSKMKNTPDSHNRVSFTTFIENTRNPELKFTVSTRGIRPDIEMGIYLKIFYMYLPLEQIQSVFGGTTFNSLLYGGRPTSTSYALTNEHLQGLEDLHIKLALTLSNHYFNEEVYQQSYSLLKHHHKSGNMLNIVSDKLAQRLRRDFPDYTLNASIIKNLNTPEKVTSGLGLYDNVVVPMDKNDDDAFLNGLPQKDRIILFGNAKCAYNCPARTCYAGFSQEIQGKPVAAHCSKGTIPRPDLGQVYFNLEKLHKMGFSTFKLIPDKSEQLVKEAIARTLQNAPNTSQNK